jgi:hypothetical protein
MILVFLLGVQGGVLAGALLCIRYLRREIAADIGPRLKRMQGQLDNLEAAVNLALVSHYAELAELPRHPLTAVGDPSNQTK